MVEALRERRFKGPEIWAQNPEPVIHGVQRKILLERSFTDINKKRHEGLYFLPAEIVSSLRMLLVKLDLPNTKTKRNVEKIVEKRWTPIVGEDPVSKNNRRVAVKHLLTLSNIAQADLKRRYQKGRIPDWEFQTLLEPIEGVRLTAMRELKPNRFNLIAKSLQKKMP